MASLLQYLRALWHATIDKKNTSSGIRTRNPRIRSPMRYPLRHGGNTTLVGLEPTTARSEV